MDFVEIINKHGIGYDEITSGNNEMFCHPFGACVFLCIFQGVSPPAISCRPFRPKGYVMNMRPEGLVVYSQG